MLANEFSSNVITDPLSILVGQLSLACEELFDNYGLKIRPVECDNGLQNVNDDINIISLLGASAENLRTSVAIQTNLSVLKATYPMKRDSLDEHKLQDWIGELSNQLLGRLKIKMVPYGCELTLGVPAVIQGNSLKTVLPKRSAITPLQYSTDTGDELYLCLSTLIEESNFILHYPDKDSEEELLAEGDFIFF